MNSQGQPKPPNWDTSPERLARMALEKAHVLRALGQMDKAIAELEVAYGQAPNLAADEYAQALIARGTYKQDHGDNTSALDDYRLAHQIAPPGPIREELSALVGDSYAVARAEATTEALRSEEEELSEGVPVLAYVEPSSHTEGLASQRRLGNCPRCGREVQPYWAECPNCRSSLGRAAELEVWFDSGLAAYNQHLWSDAERFFTRVIKEQPGYARSGYEASKLLDQTRRQLRGPTIRYWWLIGGGTLLALAVLLAIAFQQDMVKKSQATATAEAQAIASAGAATRATSTARALNTAQAQLTTEAQAQMTALAVQNLHLAFGPLEGELVEKDAQSVTFQPIGVALANFVATVTFYNPSGQPDQTWDYGLIFRRLSVDEEYRLSVDSTRHWTLTYLYKLGDEVRFVTVAGGVLENFNISPEGSNLLELIVIGDQAYFLVNGNYIATLTTNYQLASGDLAIASALVQGHQVSGRAVRFEDFTIWTMDPRVLAAGRLDHYAENNQIEVKTTNANLTNFMVELHFQNPYSTSEHDWSYGFLFRRTGDNQEYRLGVRSDKTWSFELVDQRDGKLVSEPLASGIIEDLAIFENQGNVLRLVVLGETSVFFVNDKEVSKLNTSRKMVSGDVWIVTGLRGQDEVTGRWTSFDNFELWPLPAMEPSKE